MRITLSLLALVALSTSAAADDVTHRIEQTDNLVVLQRFVSVVGDDDAHGRAARERLRLLIPQTRDTAALQAIVSAGEAADIVAASDRLAALQQTVAPKPALTPPEAPALAEPRRAQRAVRPRVAGTITRAAAAVFGPTPVSTRSCDPALADCGVVALPRIEVRSPPAERTAAAGRSGSSAAETRSSQSPVVAAASAPAPSPRTAPDAHLKCGALTPECARNQAMCGCEFGGLN